MAYDRKDFDDGAAERKQARRVEFLPMARVLAGAAPVMSALTGDASWDRYLTYLQGFVERTTAALVSTRAKLDDPNLWGHLELVKLKSDILVAEGMVQALTLAINLPKAILEGAEQAQKLITEFEQEVEKKNEVAAKTQS